jgi:hypothetical protein
MDSNRIQMEIDSKPMDYTKYVYFMGEHPMAPPNKKRRIEYPIEDEPPVQMDESIKSNTIFVASYERLMKSLSSLNVC